VCNKKRRATSLQIHHITYKNLFHEEPEDLIILCGTCHMKAHGLIKPKKQVHKKKKKKRRPSINDVLKKYKKGVYKTPASFEKAYRQFI
jgi:5-methylcytosine-specific restriction endonuclease McrA